ncbi:hypothetical protein K1719_005610 [Acacia pycnantha]|nr:hypothetical protein K1719_005610 [Acacia pycnantha]
MSESKKCMAILRWKGVSISIVRLLKNRESNGQEQEVDIFHASSLTKLSRDKRDVTWLYDRLYRINNDVDPLTKPLAQVKHERHVRAMRIKSQCLARGRLRLVGWLFVWIPVEEGDSKESASADREGSPPVQIVLQRISLSIKVPALFLFGDSLIDPGNELGLNFTPPYMAPNKSASAILQGVNYASAGSGILNQTGFMWVSLHIYT